MGYFGLGNKYQKKVCNFVIVSVTENCSTRKVRFMLLFGKDDRIGGDYDEIASLTPPRVFRERNHAP